MYKYITTFIVGGLVSYMVFMPSNTTNNQLSQNENIQKNTTAVKQDIKTNIDKNKQENKNKLKLAEDKKYLYKVSNPNGLSSKLNKFDTKIIDKEELSISDVYVKKQKERQKIAEQRYLNESKKRQMQQKMIQSRENYIKAQQLMAQRAKYQSIYQNRPTMNQNGSAVDQNRLEYQQRQQQIIQQMKLQQKISNRVN